jgi:hypothetical protein
MDKTLPWLILLSMLIGCRPPKAVSPTSGTPSTASSPSSASTKSPESSFNGPEVCQFPQKASDPLLQSLAGGEWKDMVVDGESLGYGCVSGRYSQKEVKLFRGDLGLAQIEYAADGTADGAKYIVVDYYVDVSKGVPHEVGFRTRYETFVSELAKISLGSEVSEAFIRKISDLNNYGPQGSPRKFEEKVGSGRVELSLVKGPPGGTIFAKTFFYKK